MYQKLLSKKKFIFILPVSYYGEGMTPGHKKDFFNLAEKIRDKNKLVEIFYSDNKNIYDSSLSKKNIFLKDIFRNKIYEDYVIVIGPLHKFRLTLFMRRNREIFYYVFDSILKTSIFAFLNNFKLFHRVIYAYLIELILRNKKIIVSSLEEYTWFSSTGHNWKNIYLMTPLQDIQEDTEKVSSLNPKKKILFYNPTGHGVIITKNIINGLIEKKFEFEIIITGVEAKIIKDQILGNSHLHFFPYVKDMSKLISECTIVILTDTSGSGFCNRAAQIRGLGVPLLCTLPSLRGTNLVLDSGVEVMYSVSQAVSYINENIYNLRNSKSSIFELLKFRGNNDINYFSESSSN